MLMRAAESPRLGRAPCIVFLNFLPTVRCQIVVVRLGGSAHPCHTPDISLVPNATLTKEWTGCRGSDASMLVGLQISPFGSLEFFRLQHSLNNIGNNLRATSPPYY